MNFAQSRRSSAFELLVTKTSETIKYKNITGLSLRIATICLSTAYYGWTVVELSAVPQSRLAIPYGPQMNQKQIYGVLQGCVPGGAIMGALISPMLMRLFTRKHFILFINLLALIIEGVIQIPNIWVLLACRVCEGIFVGTYMAIVPIYINDLSPKQVVGSFGVFTNLFVVISIVTCFAIQIIFQEIDLQTETFWRLMWGINAVLIIIQSILLIVGFVPESPNSLIMKGCNDQAREVVLLYHLEEYADEVMDLRIAEVQLQQGGDKIQKQKPIKISIKAYIVAFQLPLMQQFVGVGSVSAQVGNIIGKFSPVLGIYLPLIVNAAQLVGNSTAVYLLSKLGRRTIALLGNGIVGAINLIIGLLFLFINTNTSAIIIAVTVFLIIYMLIFGLTLGPITWLYVPEVIPADIVPFATVNNWVAATIVYTMTPIVVGEFNDNPDVLFFIFTAITTLFFIMNLFLMEETRGLTREQIARKYGGEVEGQVLLGNIMSD